MQTDERKDVGDYPTTVEAGDLLIFTALSPAGWEIVYVPWWRKGALAGQGPVSRLGEAVLYIER